MAEIRLSLQRQEGSVPLACIDGGRFHGEVVYANTAPDKPEGKRRPAPTVDFAKALKGSGLKPRERADADKQLQRALRGGHEPDDERLAAAYHAAADAPEARRKLELADGHFRVLPSLDTRATVFVSGKSGSGKTVWIRGWLEPWRAAFPDATLHLFSVKSEDPSIDELKPSRVDLEDLPDPDDVEAMKIENLFQPNDAVVFDDCESASKKVNAAIDAIRDTALKVGRQRGIYVAVTNHTGAQHNKTKVALREAQGVVVFPGRTSKRQVDYLLGQYADLEPADIAKVRKMRSRWCFVRVDVPAAIIGETSIQLV